MSKEAEKLRRVEGGVGTFNTKCIREVKLEAPVGDVALGIQIPAGSIVCGAYIKNKANDLAGTGATLAISAGEEDLIEAVGIADLKGKGVGGALVDGAYFDEDTEVVLTIASAAVTAGTVDIGIVYM